jgi:phospholipase/carboxylesterase
MDREKAGSLEILEQRCQDIHNPYIIMLHGYGASAQDLAPLANEVKISIQVSWLFPNAPLEIPFTPFFTGRAWFPIDMNELYEKQGDYSKVNPMGLEESRLLIEGLLNRLPVAMNKVILGGFSQGAMVATEVALNMKEKLAGLAIFSGTLIDEARWQELALKKAGLNFFQTHGLDDELLSIHSAEKLEALLKSSGLKGDLIAFEGGHTIDETCLAAFKKFIIKSLSQDG